MKNSKPPEAFRLRLRHSRQSKAAAEYVQYRCTGYGRESTLAKGCKVQSPRPHILLKNMRCWKSNRAISRKSHLPDTKDIRTNCLHSEAPTLRCHTLLTPLLKSFHKRARSLTSSTARAILSNRITKLGSRRFSCSPIADHGSCGRS